MPLKTIYLTIDDAPSKDFRLKVDFLCNRGIPAIFFCIGKSLERREEDAEYAIGKGFVIGNHSYDHRTFSSLSLEEARAEIAETDRIIENLYEKAGVNRPTKVFRFPYGDKGGDNTERVQEALTNYGYKQPRVKGIEYEYFYKNGLDKDADVFWTFDVEEHRLKDWNSILDKMRDPNPQMGGSLVNPSSSDIVLIHDHEDTTALFFRTIEHLSAGDFVFGGYGD